MSNRPRFVFKHVLHTNPTYATCNISNWIQMQVLLDHFAPLESATINPQPNILTQIGIDPSGKAKIIQMHGGTMPS